MAKRSITDEEISLIKAMLSRGMKNKDIQFFFNRPDRPVNSGRITSIKNGSYGNSSDIPAASEIKFNEFINVNSSVSASSKILIPDSSISIQDYPLSDGILKSHFNKDEHGIWRLQPGETDQHECKSGFGFKHSDKWLKPVAALANNRGGYVFFGVNDKGVTSPIGEDLSYAVTGLNSSDFAKADPADFAKKLKSIFDPTPRIETTTYLVDGKTIGVIYVEQHASRPIIAIRSEGEIREGDIFFRYPGQSTRIKYSDLRAILDARDALARAQILPMIERLMSLGPSRAMIADLERGELIDGQRSIHIDESLLEKISFIKEGEFSETTGAPTLRLVGDVTTAGAATTIYKKGVVTRSDLIRDFLQQQVPFDPKEYIRFAVEASNGQWVPFRYFALKAGMSSADLIEFIKNTSAPMRRRNMFIERVKNSNSAYTLPGKKVSILLQQILDDKVPSIASIKDAGDTARAVMGIPPAGKIKIQSILGLLGLCIQYAEKDPSGVHASSVRKAICRIDEIAFSETAA